MAEIKSLDLGNLKPIYERELINKRDVHQGKGRWGVSKVGGQRTTLHHLCRGHGFHVFTFYAWNFDCDWSLLSRGVAERRRCDLGNLNPN